MSDIPQIHCTGSCGRTLPATAEYFHPNRHRCKQCIGEYNKHYYANKQNRIKEYNGHRKEKKQEYDKHRYANPEMRSNVRRHQNQQYHDDPEIRKQCYTRVRNRYARKKSVQGTHTSEQIQDQLKRQKYRCYYAACGNAKFKKKDGKYIYHIDHTYPISRVAGSDIPANSIDYLVLACPACNHSKKDKFPWEWAEGGRLC